MSLFIHDFYRYIDSYILPCATIHYTIRVR